MNALPYRLPSGGGPGLRQRPRTGNSPVRAARHAPAFRQRSRKADRSGARNGPVPNRADKGDYRDEEAVCWSGNPATPCRGCHGRSADVAERRANGYGDRGITAGTTGMYAFGVPGSRGEVFVFAPRVYDIFPSQCGPHCLVSDFPSLDGQPSKFRKRKTVRRPLKRSVGDDRMFPVNIRDRDRQFGLGVALLPRIASVPAASGQRPFRERNCHRRDKKNGRAMSPVSHGTTGSKPGSSTTKAVASSEVRIARQWPRGTRRGRCECSCLSQISGPH